jgi:hypothetical protein
MSLKEPIRAGYVGIQASLDQLVSCLADRSKGSPTYVAQTKKNREAIDTALNQLISVYSS